MLNIYTWSQFCSYRSLPNPPGICGRMQSRGVPRLIIPVFCNFALTAGVRSLKDFIDLSRNWSTFRKGGCSGSRVYCFTSDYRLFYYIILPPSTAPPPTSPPFDEYPLIQTTWNWLKVATMDSTLLTSSQNGHGSFLIRRQRGHPGLVLPLVISNSANHEEGVQLESSPIRNEPT